MKRRQAQCCMLVITANWEDVQEDFKFANHSNLVTPCLKMKKFKKA